MSYVAINVLSVPSGAGSTLEEGFAARQGAVDAAPGFEHFELLRPVEGTSDYLVYTRWRSEADFVAWRESQAFGQGHAQAGDGPAGARPAATGSTIWAFEVAQQSDGKAAHDDGGSPVVPTDPQHATPRAPHEDVAGIVSTDPGAQQAQGQGEQSPQEQGTQPMEDPAGEPGFA